LFDYPGGYQEKSNGEAEVKIRMQEEEAPYDVVAGASGCVTFTVGGKFTLRKHPCEAENQAYVLASMQHSATDASYGQRGRASQYSTTCTGLPASVQFRPARLTPRPTVQGPQTAVVVGKAGEEIYVDKYGRIKVQFFWDREGKKDENSSCWIRVAENWAGK